MSNLYNRLQELCEEKGVSGYRMCKDVGIQPSIMTDLKMGRRASMKVETAQKVADYFGVTVGYLLGEGKEKAPTQDGERGIDEQNLKVAFFRGADPTLTKEDMDAMWEDARAFRDFIVAKRKREKEKNGG